VFKKVGFQHQEGWMMLGTEERSVRFGYVSTWNVSTGNRLRKHVLRPGWIQDSMPIKLHALLRVRYRIYKLSTELMKFYIARKPTSEPRSLSLEFASTGFLIKSGLFELPLLVCPKKDSSMSYSSVLHN